MQPGDSILDYTVGGQVLAEMTLADDVAVDGIDSPEFHDDTILMDVNIPLIS